MDNLSLYRFDLYSCCGNIIFNISKWIKMKIKKIIRKIKIKMWLKKNKNVRRVWIFHYRGRKLKLVAIPKQAKNILWGFMKSVEKDFGGIKR